jgi:hypothetical protein
MSKDDSPQEVAPTQDVAPPQEVAPTQEVVPPQDPAFCQGAQACQALVLDGTRSSWTGEPVQDDRVVSAARIAALDERDWTVSGGPVIVRGRDPLVKMDAESF